jgi:hypothetical protein
LRSWSGGQQFRVADDAKYMGFDAEQAVLLDASSRRLEAGGPIVAGGAER